MFDEAVMTSKEVRRYNRVAHQYGRHLCSRCLREFDYTTDHFYETTKRRADGTVILFAWCKACAGKQNVANNRMRYAVNADYREKRKQGSRDYWNSLSETAKKAIRRKRVIREEQAA